MLEQDLRNELNRINGALEVLGLLHEKLILQNNEIGAESAQEAMDEMLTQVDAMHLEYQRRRHELHPHHKSYQFYLVNGEVMPIVHDCYGLLVKGEAVASEFARQTLRLADWYVRMDDEVPKQVVNETYSWQVFDEFGRLDLHAARAIEASPLPTKEERKQMQNQLFKPNPAD
jgi:hypothetical protein